jgi:hypothetical protein
MIPQKTIKKYLLQESQFPSCRLSGAGINPRPAILLITAQKSSAALPLIPGIRENLNKSSYFVLSSFVH